jgi:transposase InsO family protein
MPNNSAPSAAPSAEALFRYKLVSVLKAAVARGRKLAAAIAEVAAQSQLDLQGNRRKVSPRSLYRWYAAFTQYGFTALEPAVRLRIAHSVVLPTPLIDFLAREKKQDPDASVPEIIRRARERGVVFPELAIDRSTVYRECLRLGVYVARRKRKNAPDRDTRRFAYPHRMQMCLCDGKHFRAGLHRLRRVALIFLDDCSRYGLHAVVGTSESADLFLRGLYEKCCRHGAADTYFLDGGPGFIALDTIDVMAKLSSLLVHGEANYPQGHGKIERFNQTALADLLRCWDGRPDIDPEPRALELRLQHYLREVYNHRPHESLDGKSPHECFHADARPLRFAASDAELRQHFVLHLARTVSNDHIVSVDSINYELPTGHARARVTLYRNLLEGTLAILHQGRLVRLHPVDLALNAVSRRARHSDGAPHTEVPEVQPPTKSAADIAFERDFAPVVDADGGFLHPSPSEDDPQG